MKNKFLVALEIVILLVVVVLSPQLKLPWMLIDDGENLRMGQEIGRHFSSGDYSWILSYEKVNGRFRPAYWLWHFANFQAFGFNAFGHHLGHLILYAFISILIFLIARKISKSNLAGVLAVVFFLFFYPAAENFYRLGTAEPPLLLLYLFVVFLLVRLYFLRKVNIFDYFLIFIVLGLTYFMKETAPILMVAFVPLFLIGVVDKDVKNKEYWFKFSFVFMAMNLVFFALTFFLKRYYDISGGYTEAYKPLLSETISRFIYYLKMIAKEYRWVLVVPTITFIYSFLRVFSQSEGKIKIFLTSLPLIKLWQIVLLFWFLIFLAIQAPWLHVMGRYLPPVTVWFSIFLGIEYAVVLSTKESFFWRVFPGRFSFRIPILKVLSLLFISWLILSHGKRINQMYQGALRGEQFTTNVVKYLAEETPKGGGVYANFSEGIMEYLYELPLHFKFFYARPDIKVDYLFLDKPNTFKKGDFIVAFKEHVQRYPWEDVKTTLSGAEEIDLYIFGPDWRILRFKEDESFWGIEKEETKL